MRIGGSFLEKEYGHRGGSLYGAYTRFQIRDPAGREYVAQAMEESFVHCGKNKLSSEETLETIEKKFKRYNRLGQQTEYLSKLQKI